VRENETAYEREARVQWMYTLSGWFVQMVVLDLVLLLYYAMEGTLTTPNTLPPYRPQWEIQVLHITVSLLYIAGALICSSLPLIQPPIQPPIQSLSHRTDPALYRRHTTWHSAVPLLLTPFTHPSVHPTIRPTVFSPVTPTPSLANYCGSR
jgi:hypothetical protein